MALALLRLIDSDDGNSMFLSDVSNTACFIMVPAPQSRISINKRNILSQMGKMTGNLNNVRMEEMVF
jgi:hypothetical protein